MVLLRHLTVPIRPALATASVLLLLARAASAQQEPPPQPPPPVETLPPSAPTEEKPARKRLRFGPQVGLYLPVSGKTRNRFGNSWSNIGFGVGNVSNIYRTGRAALDVSFISNSKGDARIFLAPIGLAYSVGLGSQERSTAFFTGVSANLVIASLRSDADDLPSRTSVTGGAGFFLGTRFSDRAYLVGRYNAFGRIRGFDLSGVNLTAGIRF